MSDDSVPTDWVEQRVKDITQRAEDAGKVFQKLRAAVQTDVRSAERNIAGATFTFRDIPGGRFGVIREPKSKRSGRVWSRVFELSETKVSVSDEDSNIITEANVVLLGDDWVLQLRGVANVETPREFSKLVLEPLFFVEDGS